jgi:hypothetical protein
MSPILQSRSVTAARGGDTSAFIFGKIESAPGMIWSRFERDRFDNCIEIFSKDNLGLFSLFMENVVRECFLNPFCTRI